nr:immunoglobulin heavy chain junction region [Macaca mulatta]MOW45516.1 immunoglobulin heavy chain junction region [Macaca mulatta]MOW45551.1 immunoglobulin heavy chain junction region [Macaca mulatta]MOW45609.1 immunoglobulin heavy chain junction region [Macaca mulatta]MOW45616.1 immunoglobulin heavy chain junction region [Macaca mulatta]
CVSGMGIAYSLDSW